MSVFDRDAKLAKAAYIFREQEKRESERKGAFGQCQEKVQEEFFNYLSTQTKHYGRVEYRNIYHWMHKHEECENFFNLETRLFVPSETLEGKIDYNYNHGYFSWTLKN